VPRSILRFALALVLCSATTASGQAPLPAPSSDELPVPFDDAGPGAVLHGTAPFPVHGLATDWPTRIDEAWGPSPWAESQMLGAFDHFWTNVDLHFACFQGIEVDWQALRDRYRPEIQAGVSRGRFAAIMNHLSLALRESHTNVRDPGVNSTAQLAPGVPLFVVAAAGRVPRFGAALTAQSDSSLLVYTAMANHPLGLVPGDIVLGYDGIPWKRIYPELLAAELPITGGIWGSSPSSWTHSMLGGAGLNWHLFETLDVVKHATGDTLHLPVAPLAAATDTILNYEQLPVPGVPMPGWGDWVSWGIVENTRIGYVYVRAWTGNAGFEFGTAIDSLLTVHQVEGLVFDFRTNFGGSMFIAYPGLQQLFATGTHVTTVAFDQRCGEPHDAMCATGSTAEHYVIHGSSPAAFAGPIAVLVGPAAVSSGDQVANLFRYHPRTRVFGKPSAAAFNAPASTASLGFPLAGWIAPIAVAEAFNVSEPGQYLTHDEFPVDEPVWLTPETVARGEDDVVRAALRWMEATPTLLAQFTATPHDLGVELRWNLGVAAYRVASVAIERAPDAAGPWTTLALEARSEGEATIAIDESAEGGASYAYRLNVSLSDGTRATFGPVSSGTELAVAASRLETSPNPASGPIRIDFAIPGAGPVRITVVDVAGRTVRRLSEGHRSAGRYSLLWDGRRESGAKVPAGVYFVRMVAPDRVVVKSFVRTG
jgi:hypothetical protein